MPIEAVTHKDMKLSPEIIFSNGEKPMDGADLTKEGSILLTDSYPSHFVRGPLWRFEKGDPVVRQGDVKPIFLTENQAHYPSIPSGSELELLAWDPNRNEAYPIMSSHSPVIGDLRGYNSNNANGFHYQPDYLTEVPEQLNFSSEFLQQMIEINFRHSEDSLTRAKHTLGALRVVANTICNHGALLTPISNFSHRPVRPEDVNQDPYVQRIVFDYMFWKRARYFTGCSFQTHVEIFDSHSGLLSINYLQQVTPLLLSLSSAGPFANGKLYLNKYDVPGLGRKREKLHSTRYLGRKYGSPSGGVIQFPAPEDLSTFFSIANQRLRDQDIPTVARTLGHHTSFRWRGDIEPRGTLEYADEDTFGAHPIIICAFQEFNKALTVKVQSAISQGRTAEFPAEFFGILTSEILQQIEKDMISVSKFGLQTPVKTADGRTVTVQSQVRRLIDWVTEPDENTNFAGLPYSVYDQMYRASKVIDESEFITWDPSSANFLSGFYYSRSGTLSQWLHRRAEHLIQIQHHSEAEAILKCITELGFAFHGYLSDSNIDNQLISVFSQ